MKRKKLTALLLTVAMTASVLVGCGGGDAGESAETTGSPETEGGGRMKRQEHPKTVKRLSTLRCLSPCPVLRSTTATRFRKLSHRRPA